MKRDLYTEVSARIVAELERGAAPWVKPWSATPGQNVPQNAVSNRPYSGCNVILLWLARNRGWASPRFLTFKQALDAGGNVRKGEHGTKVYFVKQLHVKDGDGEEAESRLIPMMREYTVFNVDQCDGLPYGVRAGNWELLYDTDPHTGTTLEVFYADQVLAGSFGAERAGWFWWTCQRGCLPITPPTGPFATSYRAYVDAVTRQSTLRTSVTRWRIAGPLSPWAGQVPLNVNGRGSGMFTARPGNAGRSVMPAVPSRSGQSASAHAGLTHRGGPPALPGWQ